MTLELTTDEVEMLRAIIDDTLQRIEDLGHTPSGALLSLERKLRRDR